MATTIATFERVYIWERPVRLYHWVSAISLVALAVTGLVIGNPPAFITAADASSTEWYGLVRLIHFAAGFIFTFALVLRIYWFFAGNEYARWHNFFPVTPALFKRQARQVGQVLKVDIFQIEKRPMEVRGHNALAAFSYAAIYLLSVFMIVTGMALYAPMSDWFLPHLFAWVTPLFGGDAHVRLWHHVGLWAFIVFALTHVYLVLFHDYVEGQGEISSMVSGVKFVTSEKTEAP